MFMEYQWAYFILPNYTSVWHATAVHGKAFSMLLKKYMYDILWWQQSDVLLILPFFVEDTHLYLPACSLFWHTYGRTAIGQTRGGDRGFEPLHAPPSLLNPPTHETSKYLQEQRWEMWQKKERLWKLCYGTSTCGWTSVCRYVSV